MGALAVTFILILGLAGRCSGGSYCLCKKGSDDALQKVLDYACENGADCSQIQPNGNCFNPDSVRDHCSYAVNSYYMNKAAQGATCDFRGAAYLSNTDPSSNGCTYPASASTPGSATTPITPGSSSPGSSSGSSSSGSPYSTSSPGSMGGGVLGTGLAPSGTDMNDMSRAPHIGLRCSLILPTLLAACYILFYC